MLNINAIIMHIFTKFAILTCALVSCGAFAQSSTIVTSGNITPNACSIAITSAGTAGNLYGTKTQANILALLDAATVSSGPNYKILSSLNDALTVTCPSPTTVTLAFVDNKVSSLPPAGATTSNSGATYTIQPFGVGDVNNAHVGMMAIYNNNNTVNGGAVPGTKLRAAIGTISWAALAGRAQGNAHPTSITPNFIYAFTPAAGAKAPVAITSMGGTIGTEMYLNRPYTAASTVAAKFKSSTTVSLRYF